MLRRRGRVHCCSDVWGGPPAGRTARGVPSSNQVVSPPGKTRHLLTSQRGALEAAAHPPLHQGITASTKQRVLVGASAWEGAARTLQLAAQKKP